MTIAVVISMLVAAAIFVSLGIAIYRYETKQDSPSKPAVRSTSSDPSNTSDPNSTPKLPVPAYPEEARQNNTYGVEIFIKYFFETYDYATHTNDLDPLWELYNYAICDNCDILRKRVENDIVDGLVVTGGKHTIRNIETTRSANNIYLGQFILDREEGKLIDKNKKVIEEFQSVKDKKVEFAAKWTEEKFMMTHLEDA